MGPDLVDGSMLALIADELDAIRDHLEAIGEALCADFAIIRAHGVTLQSLDELAQRHENLARVLRAREMRPAVDAISLESLRKRLTAAMDGQAAAAS